MASPWNQHCANCIDTLSFPIAPGHLQQARGAQNGLIKDI